MMKKLIAVVMALMLLSGSALAAETDSPSAELKWSVKIGKDWSEATGEQTVNGNEMVFTVGQKLYKINRLTGETIKTADMSAAPSWGGIAPVVVDDKIIVALDGGIIEAYDYDEMNRLFTTETFGGQVMTDLVSDGTYVYTGFMANDGKYVAINLEDGATAWTFACSGGFYGADARIIDNYILFGSDKGSDPSAKLYVLDKATGDKVSEFEVDGNLRSGTAYENGRLYFVTTTGYLYSASFKDGSLTDVKSRQFEAGSTTTPTVADGRVYFGMGGFTGPVNGIAVADADTLEQIYIAETAGQPQSNLPVVKGDGENYIFTTYNAEPGGLLMLTDNGSNTTANIKEIFTPKDDQVNYCWSNITVTEDNYIYYKNDSGYLFGLKLSLPSDENEGNESGTGSENNGSGDGNNSSDNNQNGNVNNGQDGQNDSSGNISDGDDNPPMGDSFPLAMIAAIVLISAGVAVIAKKKQNA